VIERLCVAILDHRIARPHRGVVADVDKIGRHQVFRRQRDLVNRGRVANDGADRVDISVVEFERVEVAKHDDRLGRVALPLLDVVRQRFGFRLALRANVGAACVIQFRAGPR